MKVLRLRRSVWLLCSFALGLQACGSFQGNRSPGGGEAPPSAPPSDSVPLDGQSGANETDSTLPAPVLVPGSGPASGPAAPEPGAGVQPPDAVAGDNVTRWLVVSCAANPLRLANSPLFIVTRARCRYLDRQEIAAAARRLPTDRVYERPQLESASEGQVRFEGAEFVAGADPLGVARFRIALPRGGSGPQPLCLEARAVFKERLGGSVSEGDRQVRWLRSTVAAAEDAQLWLPESSLSTFDAQVTARRYLEQPTSQVEILILCAWQQDAG